MKVKKPSKPRIGIWLSIGILLLFIFLVQLFLGFLLAGKIEQRTEKKLDSLGYSGATVKIEYLGLDWSNLKLKAQGILISSGIPDKKQQRLPVFTAALPSLEIDILEAWKLARNKKLSVKRVILKNPELTFRLIKDNSKQKRISIDSLFNSALPVELISAELLVTQGTKNYYLNQDTLFWGGLSLYSDTSVSLRIDSALTKINKRNVYLKEMNLEPKAISIKSLDIKDSTKNSILKTGITLHNLSYDSLLYGKSISLNSIELDSLNINAYQALNSEFRTPELILQLDSLRYNYLSIKLDKNVVVSASRGNMKNVKWDLSIGPAENLLEMKRSDLFSNIQISTIDGVEATADIRFDGPSAKIFLNNHNFLWKKSLQINDGRAELGLALTKNKSLKLNYVNLARGTLQVNEQDSSKKGDMIISDEMYRYFPDDIQLSDFNLSYYAKESQKKASVSGLDLFLSRPPKDSIYELNYWVNILQREGFNLKNLSYEDLKTNGSISGSQVAYDRKTKQLKAGQLKINTINKKNRRINSLLKQVSINKVELKDLFRQNWNAGSLTIESSKTTVLAKDYTFGDNPDISGNFLPDFSLDSISIGPSLLDMEFGEKEDRRVSVNVPELRLNMGKTKIKNGKLKEGINLVFSIDTLSQIKFLGNELNIAKVNYDFNTQNLRYEGVKLRYEDKLKKYRVQLDLPIFEIRGSAIKRLINQKSIVMDTLLIKYPVVDIAMTRNSISPKNVSKTQLYEEITKNFSSVDINKIDVEGLQLRYRDPSQKLRLEQMHFSSNDLKVDKKTLEDPERILFARDTRLKLSEYEFYINNHRQKLTFEEMNLSTQEGMIDFSNVHLETPIKSDSTLQVFAYIPDVKFSHVNFDKLYEERFLQAGAVEFQGKSLVQLELPLDQLKIADLMHPADSTQGVKRAAYLSGISLDSVYAPELGFRASISDSADNKWEVSGGSDIRFFGIESDSLLIKDQLKYLEIKDHLIRFSNVDLNLPSNFYSIYFDSIYSNTSSNILEIDSFKLIPRYSLYDFAPAYGEEIDRVDLVTNKIRAYNLDYQALRDGEFVMDSCLLSGFKFDVFRDKRVEDPKPEVQSTPHELFFNKLPPTKIRKLLLRDWFISYAEHATGADTIGAVTFENMTVDVFNVINKKEALDSLSMMLIDGQAKVMGEGVLTALFEIPLLHPKERYVISGGIGPMDIRSINPMLKPIASMKVKEGNLNGLEYEITIDRDRSDGYMNIRYDNLKISVFNKEGNNKGKRKAMVSFLANTFLINSRNPRYFRLKEGEVYYDRNPNKFIFNYWAQTFFSGMRSSVMNISNKPKEEGRKPEDIEEERE